jgi:hypothetical protein
MKFIIAMILLLALVVVVLKMLCSAGPRVTRIEDRRDEDGDERKDGE